MDIVNGHDMIFVPGFDLSVQFQCFYEELTVTLEFKDIEQNQALLNLDPDFYDQDPLL